MEFFNCKTNQVLSLNRVFVRNWNVVYEYDTELVKMLFPGREKSCVTVRRLLDSGAEEYFHFTNLSAQRMTREKSFWL
jgi:hypothetical protein